MAPAPRIGRPRSIEEIEKDRIEAALDAERAETKPVELSPRERAQEETERKVMLEALKDTRPSKQTTDSRAPESLDPRVKLEPESAAQPLEAVAPVVPAPDAQLAEATERHRLAQETLAAAQAEAEEADAALAQAQIDHAAAQAEQTLQRHLTLLNQALAVARRQEGAFLQLWGNYGGVGRGGVSHGPLARYAKTIPSGDERRRTRLMELYREASVLMEQIRLGHQAAHRAVEAIQTALTVGGVSDYAELRLELAQRACEEAGAHDPGAVEQACRQLIANVKAVDGEPGPDIAKHLDPDLTPTRPQQRAEGVDPGILA
jgi:hypothetical protein